MRIEFLLQKFILLVVGMCFISLSAQDEEIRYTRAGFKAGMQRSAVFGDIADVASRYRMHIGAVIVFPVITKFSIVTEVIYTAQGYSQTQNGIRNNIDLNYLALPVLVQYELTEQLLLQSGPQFATNTSVANSVGDTSDSFFNTYKSSDFSWSFGLGYQLPSGIFFQFRQNLGLGSILNTNPNGISAKSSISQFAIGYLFKTKNNRRQVYQNSN